MISSFAFFGGCENSSTIVEGLDEKTANEAIIVLHSRGIHAEKKEMASGDSAGGGGDGKKWTISVPAADSVHALSILTSLGFPKPSSQNMLSLFAPSGLIPTPQEELIRFRAALEENLAASIRKFDGVIDAQVYISSYQNLIQKNNYDINTADPSSLTASIYIKHNGVLDNPNSQLKSKIKRLVANSIGMLYEKVNVIGERASVLDSKIPYPDAIEGNNHQADKKEYRKVLGMTIAEDSLASFRSIILGMTIGIFLLILIILWFVWKNSTLVSRNWKELFSLKPFNGEVDNGANKQTPPPTTPAAGDASATNQPAAPATPPPAPTAPPKPTPPAADNPPAA